MFRTPLSSKIMISAAKTKIRVRKITGFILMDEGPLCCPIPIWPQKIWNSGEGKSNLPHLRIRCNQKSNRFSDFSHWLVCLRRLLLEIYIFFQQKTWFRGVQNTSSSFFVAKGTSFFAGFFSQGIKEQKLAILISPLLAPSNQEEKCITFWFISRKIREFFSVFAQVQSTEYYTLLFRNKVLRSQKER